MTPQPRKAIITGVTGQDGSYLAENLLAAGFDVWGILRRSSNRNFENIQHLTIPSSHPHFGLAIADLTDPVSVRGVLARVKPDYVYNLAAMSFVGASWEQPVLTFEVNALGFLNLLEAVRDICPEAHVYQASTSEMFGNSRGPQNEQTPMIPRSPYGVSKLAAHRMAQVYRESHGLWVTCGILYNHECVSGLTPLLIRRGDGIEVVTPYDLVPIGDSSKGKAKQTWELEDTDIWDGEGWVELRCVTATAFRSTDDTHKMLEIGARGGTVDVTVAHNMLDVHGDKMPARDVKLGAHLLLSQSWPKCNGWASMSDDLAAFLGYMVADGYVERHGGRIQYTKNDPDLRNAVTDLWHRLFGGNSREWQCPSGFETGGPVTQVALNGVPSIAPWLRSTLYSRDLKQIPPMVLNASATARRAFLDAYYAGDGLKAGSGLSLKTNSPVLALGLVYLYGLEGHVGSVYVEHRDGRRYYGINLRSNHRNGLSGEHLIKDPAEVRSVQAAVSTNWVFDLETSTGRFMAGVGRLVISNSPRRGMEFVSRKVAHGVVQIAAGKQTALHLGNLSARRDWGYAPDYVGAMRLMMERDIPDDFVIGTGVSNTVRDLVELAFGIVGIQDWEPHCIGGEPDHMRPAEVYNLVADAGKAREVLGWQPKTNFATLVGTMVMAECEREKWYPVRGPRQ